MRRANGNMAPSAHFTVPLWVAKHFAGLYSIARQQAERSLHPGIQAEGLAFHRSRGQGLSPENSTKLEQHLCSRLVVGWRVSHM